MLSEVNSWISARQTTVEAFTKDVFVNQERKLGDKGLLDTIVVSTINYADSVLAVVSNDSARTI